VRKRSYGDGYGNGYCCFGNGPGCGFGFDCSFSNGNGFGDSFGFSNGNGFGDSDGFSNGNGFGDGDGGIL
jgi:hypothetical protein